MFAGRRGSILNTNTRLRIATRIHFGLLRHLGEGIDVGTMLKSEPQAREVLWVCDALGDPELAALAMQYRRCRELEAQMGTPGGHVVLDTAWGRDTSGFGLSQINEGIAPGAHPAPADTAPADAAAPKRSGPMAWLRRGHHGTR
jgi:hypothetical protein